MHKHPQPMIEISNTDFSFLGVLLLPEKEKYIVGTSVIG